MKLSTVMMIGLAAVVGYLVWTRTETPQTAKTASQTGGAQTALPSDPWASLTHSVQSVFNTWNAFAQTAPRSQ